MYYGERSYDYSAGYEGVGSGKLVRHVNQGKDDEPEVTLSHAAE
jgi:hypothetical protein